MKRIVYLLLATALLAGCQGGRNSRNQYVRHIIMWTLNDSIEESRKAGLIEEACLDFYTLKDKIPGIVSMDAVYEGRLESSNCDFMYDIVFENQEALKNFSQHPEHLKCAGALKPYIKSRTCLDVSLQ
ncbi:MAG: Dabb family protein [Bacteroidaceae bacterium]|nr:Dabb family protein [Bacteroidaceae bacterium]